MTQRKRLTSVEQDRRNRLLEHRAQEDYEQEVAEEEATRALEGQDALDKFRSGKFVKGHAKVGGRVAGTPNKMTVLMKFGVMAAAEKAGYVSRDKRGIHRATAKGGAEGYMLSLAVHHPNLFTRLMQAVFMAEANGKRMDAPEAARVFKTVAEMKERMKERGIPIPRDLQIPKLNKDVK